MPNRLLEMPGAATFTKISEVCIHTTSSAAIARRLSIWA